MLNPSQNAPSVGREPSCTGTRDGRKVFCQRLLFTSQKGTQTQAGGWQPSSQAPGWELSVCPGHKVGPQPLSAADNIIYQKTVQIDPICFTFVSAVSSLKVYLLKKRTNIQKKKTAGLADLEVCRHFQKTAGYITWLFVKWYDSSSECWLLHSLKWLGMP